MALKKIGVNEVLCQIPHKEPSKEEKFERILISRIDEVRIAVQGVLIEKDKILLVESIINGKKLDIPGGGIEKGEHWWETVAREFIEETGLIVGPINPITFLGIIESCFRHKEKIYHNIRLHYLVKRIDGKIKPRKNGKDTFGVKFYLLDELEKGKYCMGGITEEALKNFVFNNPKVQKR